MKNLKKFQEFALTQEEQKNTLGGRLDAKRWWKCTLFIDGSSSIDSQPIWGDTAAVNYCSGVPNCAGCYVMGEGQ
jgi:hypothetical protein